MAPCSSSKSDKIQEIIRLVGERTRNYYDAHRLCCSESILLVMNEGFGGGLPADAAVRLGSGFCEGMGGAGCICGALNASNMVLSLFLGPNQANGLSKKELQKLTRLMHDRFKERFGAACCRVLTKKVKHDKKMQRANCMQLTGGGAEILTDILLQARPDFVERANMEFLQGRDTKLQGLAQKVGKFFKK